MRWPLMNTCGTVCAPAIAPSALFAHLVRQRNLDIVDAAFVEQALGLRAELAAVARQDRDLVRLAALGLM